MKACLSVAAGVFALALAVTASAQEAPEPAPAPAEAPAAEAAPVQAAEESPGKGRVVFFRPSRLPGAVYTYHVVDVGDDGKKDKESVRLGALPNGGAFSIELEAGVYNFNISGPMAVNLNEDRLRMEIEPGETYYVEQTVRMGLVTGGFRLIPADEQRFTSSKAKFPKPKK